MRTGLTLRHARAAAAGVVRASRAPSPSRLRGRSRARRRGTRRRCVRRSSVSIAGMRRSPTRSVHDRGPLARAVGRAGRRRRGAARRRRTGRASSPCRRRVVGAEAAHRVLEAARERVVGRRRSPRRRARTSCTGQRRARPRRLRATRPVTSLRLRVKTRTSSPARCTWMRAPSSFHSTDAGPAAASASATAGAPAASIGWTARRTSRPTPASPPAPSVSATPAVRRGRRSASRPGERARREPTRRGRSRRPSARRARPGAARRRAGAGGSRPRRAWRARRLRAGSAGGRRPNRFPPSPGAGRGARSTSVIVSVGATAGVTSSRDTVAQPTPMRPWRGSPIRNPTTVSISSGAARPSTSASAAIFVVRDRVAATAADVATRSANSTAPRLPLTSCRAGNRGRRGVRLGAG